MARKDEKGRVFYERRGMWLIEVWERTVAGTFYWGVTSEDLEVVARGTGFVGQLEAQRCAIAVVEILLGES